VEYISQITEYINIDIMYIEIILKMIAIAYICEFASCLCKDAGYSAIGTEIELAGRVSMVVISLPVLLSVIDIITRLVE
jgi:stage III sporulation protein AD